ncbi:DUF1109 family protein [Rhodobacter sp. NTK016B]|uniref:NrsF family protein n=1 Tax=Rhodobacter sp. NTK016B TaxID=2759676 RepID=UPI001A9033E4|nr:NrsF family protein [Rhodobacter sp. NTK016B]MBN8290722.1 DUF1109 family protein [Rhodobacter sp. NTK016B]
MKTDALIAALAADTTPRPSPGARMMRVLPLAVALSLAALLAGWHVRPDLAATLSSVAVYKTAVPVALALSALWLARGLARPEARARREWALIGVLIAALALALVWGLAVTPAARIAEILDTPDYTNCLISVPTLAALPLAASLWALRAGAPLHPARAGAAAGLIAGGAGAAIYSLHCPHDHLMYFFPAYGVAMAAVTLAGALIGALLLRW